jgi:ABC-type transporter Mla subunit MlaD
MQILRNEIRTGILVLFTLGLSVGVILYLSAPGLFRPVAHYKVFFDDAAAIKPGASVMLAGRKIGTVESIQSPVAPPHRPPGRPECEVMITVQVASDAEIFKANDVSMRTFGLLSEYVIDFTNGDSNSGRAVTGDWFVGTRSPDLSEIGPVVLKRLDPVLKELASTLTELRRTSVNLTDLTAKDSKMVIALNGTLENFRSVGGNLKTMTDKGGSVEAALSSLQNTLQAVQQLTSQASKDNNLEKTLANLNGFSERLKSVLGQLQNTLGTALPRLDGILADLNDLTAKLKSQPWRIVWPTTIKYDKDRVQDARERVPAAPSPRKSKEKTVQN